MGGIRARLSSRRNTELGLLLAVVLLIVGMYVAASLGTRAAIPANIGPFLGALFGTLLIAHLANRKLAPNADPILLPLAALLNGIGYVEISRMREDLAAKQVGWTALSIVLYVLTLLIVRNVSSFRRLAYTFALLGIGLLLLPLVPVLGLAPVNGARIWVRVGSFTMQPGEFAKIALSLFFAAYLVDRRALLSSSTAKFGPFRVPEPRHLVPLVIAFATALVVMVGQKDLGTALLFFVLFMVMLWAATGRKLYPVAGLTAFSLAAYGAWTQFSHVQNRVQSWLDPWADPYGPGGNQIIQGTFSLAWGGLTGTGLGLGMPERVPVAYTDFIFTALGEELGLFGASAILMGYLLIAGSGFRIAVRATDDFHKLLATGLSALVALQAFVIVAGILRVMPLTGVTLPFVSYGGSSLLANYLLLALLMRISDESQRTSASRGRVAA